MPVSFPGLFGDWEFTLDPIAIHVGKGIYWYGIILAVAMLAGLYLAMKQGKHYGFTEDDMMDLVLWAVPFCIIGARIYYVLFYLDLYRNADGSLDWGRMVAVWDGGIAIYGAVIAAVLVVVIYAKRKKVSTPALMDAGCLGLILGQIIGRWANFVNREAFGGVTDLPWRMRVWVSEFQYADVHPTFFYESMWNLIGLLLLLFVVSNWGITTLFDGKGSFKNIYMSVAYALTPYILLQIPMVIMSNFVTTDEGVFYYLMDSISLLWSGGLILSGLMKIHDYTMSKTVLSTLVSIVGMLAIALLCLILFSMFSEAIGYFVSLFQEIRIRIY